VFPPWIERNPAAAVAKILDERTAIVADVDEAGLDAHDITSIFATAADGARAFDQRLRHRQR
jgi:hypothetical protein